MMSKLLRFYESVPLFLSLLFHFVTSMDLEVTNYLREFGYLPEFAPNAQISAAAVEEAVKELQRMGNVPITGRVDVATISLMHAPRCGVKDRDTKKRKRRYRENHKWRKHDLTYRVDNLPRLIPDRGQVRREVFEAARVWADVTGLTLTESTEKDADILISFQRGSHGDGGIFDGRGSVLAHAFGPGQDMGGDIHFDDDEAWTTGVTSQTGETSLRMVAMHEIGHALGLPHSEYRNSIMSPFYNPFSDPSLTYYDIVEIQRMYGVGDYGTPPPTEAPTTSTTTTMPTTTFDLVPDPCDTDVDAITTIRGEYHLFKGKYFWRVSEFSGRLVMEPRLVSSIWSEVTTVDAAVNIDDDIYFFTGHVYYIYQLHTLRYGPQNISHLGLKDVDRVDAAYRWRYYKTAPPVYFWSGDLYWKFDKNKHEVEPSYPRNVEINWGGIPRPVSAAFSVKNDLYFVKGKTAHRFNDFKMKVEEGVPLSSLWKFCHKAEYLTSSSYSGLKTRPLNFLLVLFTTLLYFRFT